MLQTITANITAEEPFIERFCQIARNANSVLRFQLYF